MQIRILGLFLFLLPFGLCGQSVNDPLNDLIDEFEKTAQGLDLPVLQLEYLPLLEQSQDMDMVQKQKSFFQGFKKELSAIDVSGLSGSSRLDYEILRFTVDLHLERIEILETAASVNEPISEDGVFNLSYGKKYYRFLLKLWTGTSISPEDLMDLGHREVKKVKNRIASLMGILDQKEFYKILNSEEFLVRDESELLTLFEERKRIVQSEMDNIFPSLENMPEMAISRNTNRRVANVPGYYNQNTFYYTLFDSPFNRRNIDWLFLHEAIPGHHFQISFENSMKLPAYRSMIASPGYREGWAAYVEETGRRVGLYRTRYDSLGKWEWDLVRSVRVVLDVGLNYYGWSRERALEYWKKHIPNKDDIADREINRMIHWPAQVHTYKLGTYLILQQKAEQRKKLGKSFNELEFHRTYLKYGSIPLEFISLIYTLE